MRPTENPEIRFERTGDEELHCFRLHLGQATVLLHARDLCDLQHKAALALLDWIADETGALLRKTLHADPQLREAAELLGIDLDRLHDDG